MSKKTIVTAFLLQKGVTDYASLNPLKAGGKCK